MVKINFDFELIGRDKKRIEEISVRSIRKNKWKKIRRFKKFGKINCNEEFSLVFN